MKLYFAPEFSSFADHIAMLEAGLEFEIAKVDLESKRLADGSSYCDRNPTGMVPALELDDGSLLTENVAILAWVADGAPHLAPDGELARARLLETLAFIASEIHKRFALLSGLAESAQAPVIEGAARSFGLVAPRIQDGFLFGETFTVADAYLFVMAVGALQMDLPLGPNYERFVERIEARPCVQLARRRESA